MGRAQSIFTIATVLMLFDEVRRLGASILASAGIAGIIIGFAAQKTIANLFAGFQLALTRPIRIHDVAIVENEWGRIEDITLTYTVVRIWDLRRLLVLVVESPRRTLVARIIATGTPPVCRIAVIHLTARARRRPPPSRSR